jgi:hypothetical protein
MEWLWIILGWVFLNIIVKLLINSIERVLKDKIDTTVQKSPLLLRYVFNEAFRYTFILILAPMLIVAKLFPRPSKIKFILEIQASSDFLFSRKRFHKQVPLMLYTAKCAILNPLILINRKKLDKAHEQWKQKEKQLKLTSEASQNSQTDNKTS